MGYPCVDAAHKEFLIIEVDGIVESQVLWCRELKFHGPIGVHFRLHRPGECGEGHPLARYPFQVGESCRAPAAVAAHLRHGAIGVIETPREVDGRRLLDEYQPVRPDRMSSPAHLPDEIRRVREEPVHSPFPIVEDDEVVCARAHLQELERLHDSIPLRNPEYFHPSEGPEGSPSA